MWNLESGLLEAHTWIHSHSLARLLKFPFVAGKQFSPSLPRLCWPLVQLGISASPQSPRSLVKDPNFPYRATFPKGFSPLDISLLWMLHFFRADVLRPNFSCWRCSVRGLRNWTFPFSCWRCSWEVFVIGHSRLRVLRSFKEHHFSLSTVAFFPRANYIFVSNWCTHPSVQDFIMTSSLDTSIHAFSVIATVRAFCKFSVSSRL